VRERVTGRLRKDKGWVEPSAEALRSAQAIVAGAEEIEEAEAALT